MSRASFYAVYCNLSTGQKREIDKVLSIQRNALCAFLIPYLALIAWIMGLCFLIATGAERGVIIATIFVGYVIVTARFHERSESMPEIYAEFRKILLQPETAMAIAAVEDQVPGYFNFLRKKCNKYCGTKFTVNTH